MSLFDYEWYDFAVAFGPHRFDLRAAERFTTKAKARGRHPLPFGSSLWPAALVLSEVLVERPETVAGKRVLELGCGLGLCAFLAARLGAKHVVASDGHADMTALFRTNLDRNGGAADAVQVDYVHYDWGADATPGAFDTVIAADVLYEPAACNLLAQAFERTCSGLGVVCDPGRPHARRFVDKMVNRGFRVEETRHALPSRFFDDPGMYRVLAMHPTSRRTHSIYWLRR